jgi:hypothetical protein
MNCERFSELIGMRCEPQPTVDGSQCIAIVTPFSFFDGDGLPVFASVIGDHVHFFDEGLTLSWLHGLGHHSLSDRRGWRALRSAIKPYGATLADDGCLEVIAPASRASAGFAQLVSSLLALDTWARENSGAAAAVSLIAEVELHLRAWHPELPLRADPEPIQGFSGEAHRFQFQKGDEFVDAIGGTVAAGGREVRKLADIRASSLHSATPVRVIVDDRRNPAQAAAELAIIGQFATAWPMSALIRATTTVVSIN